jgi:hypothetical protein
MMKQRSTAEKKPSNEERFDLVEDRFTVEVPTNIRAGLSFTYWCRRS